MAKVEERMGKTDWEIPDNKDKMIYSYFGAPFFALSW